MHLCAKCIDIASFRHFLLNFDYTDGLAFYFYNAIIFLDKDYSCYPVPEFLFLSVVVLYLFFF